MYRSTQLDVWNLTPGTAAATGAQTIFNVVGRVKNPHEIERLVYRLNDLPERPVVFNSKRQRSGRLHRLGDFSIDTIGLDELKLYNRLVFRLDGHDNREHTIEFCTQPFPDQYPAFKLDLQEIETAEQAGQIVDGRWQISRDKNGEVCLEISEEDAGYDRIILFGRHDWTTNYEIVARFCVTRWTGAVHNVGMLFKWQPHLQGDGTILPIQWTTGLGYYSSDGPGLRLSYGIQVGRRNQGGEFHILGQRPYSYLRHLGWQLQYGKRSAKRLGHERVPLPLPTAQLIPGIHYYFRVRVHQDVYTLTLWKDGKPEPMPQLVVPQPTAWLSSGAVGIVAYHCAMRLYEFKVSPLPAPLVRSSAQDISAFAVR